MSFSCAVACTSSLEAIFSAACSFEAFAFGASIKYIRTEGEGGGGPKAYVVSKVA